VKYKGVGEAVLLSLSAVCYHYDKVNGAYMRSISLYNFAEQSAGCASRTPMPTDIAVSTDVSRAYGIVPNDKTWINGAALRYRLQASACKLDEKATIKRTARAKRGPCNCFAIFRYHTVDIHTDSNLPGKPLLVLSFRRKAFRCILLPPKRQRRTPTHR